MTILRTTCIVTVLAAVLIAIWRPSETSEMFAGLEGRLLDLRYAIRGTRDAPGDVVILAIDDKALSKFGEFPVSRSSLATAISQITKQKPSIAALDLLLIGGKPGDAELAKSFEEASNVAVAISFSKKGEPPEPSLMAQLRGSIYAAISGTLSPSSNRMLGPQPRLAAHTTLGHVNVARDAGGSLRRIPVAISFGDGFAIPALSIVAARAGLGVDRSDVVLVAGTALRMGNRSIELDRQGNALLNYFGPVETIPTFSLADAGSLSVEGKVVFIGGTAQGYGDRFATPFDRGLPGVEALATLAQNVISQNTLKRNSTIWVLDIFLASIAAFLSTMGAARKALASAFSIVGLIWMAGIGVLQIAFQNNLWLDASTIIMALAFGSLGGLLARQLTLARRSENLARYGSPKIMEAVAASTAPSFDGRLQNAAALFVDAAGFTPLSHALGPKGTTKFLKEFHAAIERAAASANGTIEQFAGDGALIVFGLPEPSDQDAANALACADRLFAEVHLLSQRLRLPKDHNLRIRVGLHYGEVMAAIVGGESHRHVTVAGSVVNAASRLEQLGKTEGADLIISEAAMAAAGVLDRTGLKSLGARQLRGLEQPIKLWARIAEEPPKTEQSNEK